MRLIPSLVFACAVMTLYAARARAQCSFYSQQCTSVGGKLLCYFSGDGRDSEPLDVFLSQRLGSISSNNTGCPQMSSGSEPIEIFLEACEADASVSVDIGTRIGKILAGTWNNQEECGKSPVHTVTSALLSDPGVVHFGGGVMIASSDTFSETYTAEDADSSLNTTRVGRPRCNEASSANKAHIVRLLGTDGTCNVVRTGHNNVELHDLVLWVCSRRMFPFFVKKIIITVASAF